MKTKNFAIHTTDGRIIAVNTINSMGHPEHGEFYSAIVDSKCLVNLGEYKDSKENRKLYRRWKHMNGDCVEVFEYKGYLVPARWHGFVSEFLKHGNNPVGVMILPESFSALLCVDPCEGNEVMSLNELKKKADALIEKYEKI